METKSRRFAFGLMAVALCSGYSYAQTGQQTEVPQPCPVVEEVSRAGELSMMGDLLDMNIEKRHYVATRSEEENKDRIVRTIHIGENERLADLLDVPVETVDSFCLTGYVHQDDLQLLRGSAEMGEYYVEGLPQYKTYVLSGLDLSDCTIEGDSLPALFLYHKDNLRYVRLPEGLRRIGIFAFYNRSDYYVNVNLPSTIEELEECALSCCSFGEHLVLPASLTHMGYKCFYVTDFRTLEMEGVPENMDRFLFQNATVESVRLPEGLDVMPQGMFYICPNLKELYLPEGLREIGADAVWAKKLNEIEFPSTLEKIGPQAFYCCSLKEVAIPDNVKELGFSSFFGNSHLEKVILGSGLETIGMGSFSQCWRLKLVHSKSVVPPFLSEEPDHLGRVFTTFGYDSMPPDRFPVLYVPAGSKDAYASAGYDTRFLEIRELAEGESLPDLPDHAGIGGVETGQNVPTVVTDLQGVRVEVESLDQLPRGIYIVNGRKYVRR